MKLLLLSSFVAVAALVAGADAPLSGKWQIFTSISGNDSDMDCTFTQQNDVLTGSCMSDRGTIEIAGKVNGSKVTWSYKSEYNGTPLTVNYQGEIQSATRIKGSVDVPEFGASGEFTANQAK